MKNRYCLVIILYTLLLYSKTLSFSFVTDDWVNLIDNSKLYSLFDLYKIFSKAQLSYGVENYYRPFDTIFFLLSFKIFGYHTFYYHFVSLLLLCIFLCLLYNFLFKLFKNSDLVAILTILFVSHPIITEAVAWYSARNQLIEAILFLVTINLVNRYYENKKLRFYIFSIASFILALLFHEIGFMLFPVMIVYFYIFIYKKRNEKHFSRYFFVFLFITVMFFLIRNYFVSVAKSEYSAKSHILTFVTIMTTYIKNIFLPFDLKIHYYDLVIKQLLDKEVLFSFLILVVFTGANILLSFKDKRALFGLLFYFISIFPASGIVIFIKKSLVSDRYAFIPLIGVIICIGSLIEITHIKEKIKYSILIIVICILTFYSFQRIEVWRDDLTNAIERVNEFPLNAIERNNLATEYIKIGNYDEASKELENAKRLSKEANEVIYNNLAYLETVKGNVEKAEEIYLEYLSINPKSFKTLYNLGTLYLQVEKLYEAKILLEKAIAIISYETYEIADAYNNLGIIASREGNLKLAKEYFMNALKIKPNEESYQNNLKLLK